MLFNTYSASDIIFITVHIKYILGRMVHNDFAGLHAVTARARRECAARHGARTRRARFERARTR